MSEVPISQPKWWLLKIKSDEISGPFNNEIEAWNDLASKHQDDFLSLIKSKSVAVFAATEDIVNRPRDIKQKTLPRTTKLRERIYKVVSYG